MNDWPTVEDLVFGNSNGLSGWLLDLALATPDGIDIFNDKNSGWIGALVTSVVAKGKAGFDTSITDTWARMISYHFLNGTSRDNFFANDTSHGAGQLWSRIVDQPSWQARFPPFPIVTVDSRPVGSNATTTDLTPTVYEVTPLEFGSWDPSLSAMVNLSYAGTVLNEGNPANDTACVTAFDQAGFVMGTSASLFNQIFDRARDTLDDFDEGSSKGLLYALSQQVSEVRNVSDDVASWPNPFQGINNGTFQDAAYDRLELIDGGSNGENVPIGPMFVRARAMDLIVAIDGSFDTEDNTWPKCAFPSPLLLSCVLILTSAARRCWRVRAPAHDLEHDAPADAADPEFDGRLYPARVAARALPPELAAVQRRQARHQLDYTVKHTRVFIDQAHNNTLAGFLPNTTQADPNWPKCLQCAALAAALDHQFGNTDIWNFLQMSASLRLVFVQVASLVCSAFSKSPCPNLHMAELAGSPTFWTFWPFDARLVRSCL
ncbi:hypothetical protein EWM64_g1817 [Hericium alpestre]|uniref:Lysophospholipase n=1 Tax=Hericium alpestre TaxID=135208 RepID=A0A4Z0A7B8_9AGAM|nr:hypothetical protein EWM64_g1817 [Hericium alpestre]